MSALAFREHIMSRNSRSSNSSKDNRSSSSSRDNRSASSSRDNRSSSSSKDKRSTSSSRDKNSSSLSRDNRSSTSSRKSGFSSSSKDKRSATPAKNNRSVSSSRDKHTTTTSNNNRISTAPNHKRTTTASNSKHTATAPNKNRTAAIANTKRVTTSNSKHSVTPNKNRTVAISNNKRTATTPKNKQTVTTSNNKRITTAPKQQATTATQMAKYTQNTVPNRFGLGTINSSISYKPAPSIPNLSITGNRQATNQITQGNVKYSQINTQKNNTPNHAITPSNNRQNPQSYLKEQDIMDPISKKIVSRSQFEQGINKSIELVRQNLYKPGISIRDPISGKNTDIYTLAENNEKRFKLMNNINKSTSLPPKELGLSDALSIAEGGLKAVNEFISDHGLNSKVGFWVQATGGAGKLVTYGQIGVEMATGDPRKAAGEILKTSIDVAAGVYTTKKLNETLRIKQPLKGAIAIGAGTIVSLNLGNSIMATIEEKTQATRQADKMKEAISSNNKEGNASIKINHIAEDFKLYAPKE